MKKEINYEFTIDSLEKTDEIMKKLKKEAEKAEKGTTITVKISVNPKKD